MIFPPLPGCARGSQLWHSFLAKWVRSWQMLCSNAFWANIVDRVAVTKFRVVLLSVSRHSRCCGFEVCCVDASVSQLNLVVTQYRDCASQQSVNSKFFVIKKERMP